MSVPTTLSVRGLGLSGRIGFCWGRGDQLLIFGTSSLQSKHERTAYEEEEMDQEVELERGSDMETEREAEGSKTGAVEIEVGLPHDTAYDELVSQSFTIFLQLEQSIRDDSANLLALLSDTCRHLEASFEHYLTGSHEVSEDVKAQLQMHNALFDLYRTSTVLHTKLALPVLQRFVRRVLSFLAIQPKRKLSGKDDVLEEGERMHWNNIFVNVMAGDLNEASIEFGKLLDSSHMSRSQVLGDAFTSRVLVLMKSYDVVDISSPPTHVGLLFRKWREQCVADIKEGMDQFSHMPLSSDSDNERRKLLITLLGCLAGNGDMFEHITSQFSVTNWNKRGENLPWFVNLSMQLMFSDSGPTLSKSSFRQLLLDKNLDSNKWGDDFGTPLREMEKIVALMLEGDIVSAIWMLSKSRHGVSPWFLAHFAEVFHWGEVRREFMGHVRSEESGLQDSMKNFREDAMKQYISSLMKIDTSWKIASSYALVACGIAGQCVAHTILSTCPFSSTRDAGRIIRFCENERPILDHSRHVIRRCYAMYLHRRGQHATALSHFAMEGVSTQHEEIGNPIPYSSMFDDLVSGSVIREYMETGDPQELGWIADSRQRSYGFLTDFATIRATRHMDPRRAGTSVIQCLQEAPKVFWLAILLEALPLLEIAGQPIFSHAETQFLLLSLQQLWMSHQRSEFFGEGDNEVMVLTLRAALARNLARTVGVQSH
eukprot:TRINITY_DN82746_c0_g1_i1.p1 TRINITY_DN82746_c0_g1~~TRINITY_DN82746_c0_g1_i1.p1  ORF type:complete len:711 (-),score=181.03 TRINITY_DN82746_c0_g1_i1:203-2335(-)